MLVNIIYLLSPPCGQMDSERPPVGQAVEALSLKHSLFSPLLSDFKNS